jgi:hypothetical protein
MVRRFLPLRIAPALMLGLYSAAGLHAAENAPASEPAGLFPFTVPWNDVSPGLTNLSAWLEKPAGKSGFIIAKEGHLWAGDRRIRLLGVNLCFNACFPKHEDADLIAPRMARFGINCVRFHHMDTSASPEGLLKDDRRTMDPEQLDRLDYLVSRLKANGIYSDLNLHVGRNFPELPTADRLDFDKALDHFVPQMVESQREYARALLAHVNPYTGLRYAEEPAVALIEISNEDGLISEWLWGNLDDLPPAYERELSRQWNDWLRARYAGAAALRAAWNAMDRPLSETELIVNGDFAEGTKGWVLEEHSGARATAAPAEKGPPAAGPSNATQGRAENNRMGAAALRVTVQQPGPEAWHVQFGQPRLKVQADSTYTLTFQARSGRPHAITALVGQAHAPWKALASIQAALDGEWRPFTLAFVAPETDEDVRVLFTDLGQAGDSCDFAAVSFRAGGVFGLRPGEELGSVAPLLRKGVAARAPAAQRDWIRFLWETEERYWTGMRRFIREELGCGSLVIGTQTNYSPFAVQAAMDVMDWHAYWQHPHFPGRPWDPVNWTVRNVPMAGAPDGGTLPGLLTRAAGKPFVCTEYNHPAPNTFSSEAFLLLGAYAALHDLDGIFAFAYSHSADWNHGTFANFFDIGEHPTKMVTLPAAAALFERGDVKVPNPKVLHYTVEGCIELIRKSGDLPTAERLGADPAQVFKGPVELELSSDAEPAAPPSGPAEFPALSITRELLWAPAPASKRGVVTVNTPRSIALIGASNDKGAFSFGGVEVTPGKTIQDWSAITMTVLQGEGFKAPARILLTATGYVQNSGMIWKDARHDSVGEDWGHAPALVEGIPATIALPLEAGTTLRAWALDGRGQRGAELPVQAGAGKATIAIGPEFKTLWYEIELNRSEME